MAEASEDIGQAHWHDKNNEDDSPIDRLLTAVGKQIKWLRQQAGWTQEELGRRIGYGVDQVSAVERGRRTPKPEFIDGVERELNAGGMFDAIRDELEQARLPKRFRDMAEWEKQAISLYTYEPQLIPGLLQTEAYARCLIESRCPPLSESLVEDRLTSRMERQDKCYSRPSMVLGFVIEEAVLRRPFGGPEVMREQLHRLLEVAQRRNVSIQVMPTSKWQHSGVLGEILVLETKDGRSIGYTESQGVSAVLTEPGKVSAYSQRLGIIRMEALDTEESAHMIEQVAGEL